MSPMHCHLAVSTNRTYLYQSSFGWPHSPSHRSLTKTKRNMSVTRLIPHTPLLEPSPPSSLWLAGHPFGWWATSTTEGFHPWTSPRWGYVNAHGCVLKMRIWFRYIHTMYLCSRNFLISWPLLIWQSWRKPTSSTSLTVMCESSTSDSSDGA